MKYYYFFFISMLLLKSLSLFCQTADLDEIHRIQSDAEALLRDAVTFLNREGLERSCQVFALDPAWRRGLVTIFVLGIEGRVYVDNGYFDCVWKKQPEKLVDFYGDPLIPAMVAQGQKGGWVTHLFLNDIRHSYVKTITYEGKTYIVGATFFHQSPVLLSILIVESIKRLWDRSGDIKALQVVNNPFGSFVYGDVYGIVMNEDGVCWGHGHDMLLVGQSLIDASSVGKSAAAAFKKVLETIKHQDHFWVEFKQHGLERALYCKKYMCGRLRKTFVFMAGYYKGVTPDLVKNMAHAIGDGLKKSSNPNEYLIRLRHGDFNDLMKGDLNVMVMDGQGVVLFYSNKAEGAAFLGKSVINYVDSVKRPYNKMMFAKLAQSPTAWMTRFHRNALERLYGYKVEAAGGPFIVQARGYYPYEHREIVQVVVDDAYDYLAHFNCPQAFATLQNVNGYHVKGDHTIFLYDVHGICLLHGIEESGIWSKSDFMSTAPEGFSDQNEGGTIRRWYVRKLAKQVDGLTKEPLSIASAYYPTTGEKNGI